MVLAYRLRSRRRTHVRWQAGFLAGYGSSPVAHLPTMCETLRRQPQGPVLQLFGSISLYGLCPTHLPREPARLSKPACVRKRRSSITWGSTVASHATPWPTPIRPGTGASTPILLSVSFIRHATFTSTKIPAWMSPTRSTRWIPPPLIFLITHKCQPQLTGDRATEESAQRHERVEEPNQRVGSGG